MALTMQAISATPTGSTAPPGPLEFNFELMMLLVIEASVALTVAETHLPSVFPLGTLPNNLVLKADVTSSGFSVAVSRN